MVNDKVQQIINIAFAPANVKFAMLGKYIGTHAEEVVRLSVEAADGDPELLYELSLALGKAGYKSEALKAAVMAVNSHKCEKSFQRALTLLKSGVTCDINLDAKVVACFAIARATTTIDAAKNPDLTTVRGKFEQLALPFVR